jgi:DMSO/TMAO reductase YedYZ molybdopterin-dependent catalytic subunit
MALDLAGRILYDPSMKRRSFLHLASLLLAGCAVPTEAQPEETPTPSPTPLAYPAGCRPTPLIAPTRPAAVPNLYDQDEIGLHVAGRPLMELDPSSYRLRVTGLVDRPLEFTLDGLRCMPKISAKVELICPGVFRDETTYSGVPLSHVLDLAGIQNSARSILMIGADEYANTIDLRYIQNDNNFLAFQWTDEPLPIFHGFPVRLVIPGQLGNAWTKYLVEMRVG